MADPFEFLNQGGADQQQFYQGAGDGAEQGYVTEEGDETTQEEQYVLDPACDPNADYLRYINPATNESILIRHSDLTESNGNISVDVSSILQEGTLVPDPDPQPIVKYEQEEASVGEGQVGEEQGEFPKQDEQSLEQPMDQTEAPQDVEGGEPEGHATEEKHSDQQPDEQQQAGGDAVETSDGLLGGDELSAGDQQTEKEQHQAPQIFHHEVGAGDAPVIIPKIEEAEELKGDPAVLEQLEAGGGTFYVQQVTNEDGTQSLVYYSTDPNAVPAEEVPVAQTYSTEVSSGLQTTLVDSSSLQQVIDNGGNIVQQVIAEGENGEQVMYYLVTDPEASASATSVADTLYTDTYTSQQQAVVGSSNTNSLLYSTAPQQAAGVKAEEAYQQGQQVTTLYYDELGNLVSSTTTAGGEEATTDGAYLLPDHSQQTTMVDADGNPIQVIYTLPDGTPIDSSQLAAQTAEHSRTLEIASEKIDLGNGVTVTTVKPSAKMSASATARDKMIRISGQDESGRKVVVLNPSTTPQSQLRYALHGGREGGKGYTTTQTPSGKTMVIMGGQSNPSSTGRGGFTPTGRRGRPPRIESFGTSTPIISRPNVKVITLKSLDKSSGSFETTVTSRSQLNFKTFSSPGADGHIEDISYIEPRAPARPMTQLVGLEEDGAEGGGSGALVPAFTVKEEGGVRPEAAMPSFFERIRQGMKRDQQARVSRRQPVSDDKVQSLSLFDDCFDRKYARKNKMGSKRGRPAADPMARLIKKRLADDPGLSGTTVFNSTLDSENTEPFSPGADPGDESSDTASFSVSQDTPGESGQESSPRKEAARTYITTPFKTKANIITITVPLKTSAHGKGGPITMATLKSPLKKSGVQPSSASSEIMAKALEAAKAKSASLLGGQKNRVVVPISAPIKAGVKSGPGAAVLRPPLPRPTPLPPPPPPAQEEGPVDASLTLECESIPSEFYGEQESAMEEDEEEERVIQPKKSAVKIVAATTPQARANPGARSTPKVARIAAPASAPKATALVAKAAPTPPVAPKAAPEAQPVTPKTPAVAKLPVSSAVKPKEKSKVLLVPSKRQPVAVVDQVTGEGQDSDDDLPCTACGNVESEAPNEIVLCDGCGKGFHQFCHEPEVTAEGLEQPEWLCYQCESAKKQDPIKSAPEIFTADRPVFDTKLFTWFPESLVTPAEACRCKTTVDVKQGMLQCCKCRVWYHPECTSCMSHAVMVGDYFYVFMCKECNDGGEDFVARLKPRWLDICHIALYHMSVVAGSQKFFDIFEDPGVVPWIECNRKSLDLPAEMEKEMEDPGFGKKIKELVLSKAYLTRFRNGRESKRKMTNISLRTKAAPTPPTYKLPDVSPLTKENTAAWDWRITYSVFHPPSIDIQTFIESSKGSASKDLDDTGTPGPEDDEEDEEDEDEEDSEDFEDDDDLGEDEDDEEEDEEMIKLAKQVKGQQGKRKAPEKGDNEEEGNEPPAKKSRESPSMEDSSTGEKVCPDCGKILRDAKKLTQHLMAVHNKGKPLQCVCGELFKWPQQLAAHRRTDCPKLFS